VILGDLRILQRACTVLGVEAPVIPWEPGLPAVGRGIHVWPLTDLDPDSVPWGKPSALTGESSFQYIVKGVAACLSSHLAGIVTAPISKLGLSLAGRPYPGHTEILASKTETVRYAMMLAGDRLRVVLVTIHCPVREIASRLTIQAILETIELTHRGLTEDLGLIAPRIAVAGLNPHCGESGLFGDEEASTIAPAVKKAMRQGMEVSGPHPPDTVFLHALAGLFDAVVCMYHDQGLVPFKLVHFRNGVNVTLGLPIVRTSVDHGTAYDLAGTGTADCASLVAAVALAERIAANRRCIPGSAGG